MADSSALTGVLDDDLFVALALVGRGLETDEHRAVELARRLRSTRVSDGVSQKVRSFWQDLFREGQRTYASIADSAARVLCENGNPKFWPKSALDIAAAITAGIMHPDIAREALLVFSEIAFREGLETFCHNRFNP